ncbi:MFS transporter [Paenibacillus pasadenensis]|uniref:MFS transporter n=1 Tax=Paenibacillus pasadenensis TaxID=217090 RepID=UPI00203E1EA8|nr:MFS transporter [Paenibacillus pasadenensis]MCM3749774.1 MFS transporter [Paenibacillus pasadenensis]
MTGHEAEFNREPLPLIQKGSQEYRRAGRSLFIAGAATFGMLYSVQPLFPVFTQEFGQSPAGASLTLSVSTALLAVALPLAGLLSDRLGRKRLMSASLLLSSLCCMAEALTPGFASLLALRALHGILLAGLPAVAMTYLAEEMDSRSLGAAMGLYISGNSIGGMLGRGAVSTISDFVSWRIGIGAVAAAGLLAALYFHRRLPEPRRSRPLPVSPAEMLRLSKEHLKRPVLLCLFGIGAVLMSSFVTLYNYIGFRLLEPPFELPQAWVGWIFILFLTGSVSSPLMGRLQDRRLALALALLLLLGGLLLTLPNSLSLTLLGAGLFTAGFFGGHAVASAWVGAAAPEGRAQASSLYLLFYYAGSSVGGSLGGLYWSSGGWPGVVAVIGLLLGAGLLLCLTLALLPAGRSSAK